MRSPRSARTRRTSIPSRPGTVAHPGRPYTYGATNRPMWGRNGAPGAAWWAKGAKNSYSPTAEPREQDLRDWPSLRIVPPVLPSEPLASSASATWTFRGPFPQPAHSLSTLRGHGHPCDSLQPRKTRFRLAVLPSPGGTPTRQVALPGFNSRWPYMASSRSRLLLAH
jgi:hypothetical protein